MNVPPNPNRRGANGDVDVVIVGGGPAGLGAATSLRELGVARVVVLEREAHAGGVPRHSEHLGYGMRDLHRVLSGPAYAAELRSRAERAGVEIRTATTALDWAGPTSLRVADTNGICELPARAVVLATGVRERPRAARLIPGDRGGGIFTTGSLQQLTALHHQRPGRRAIIIGAEHVSFSAVLALQHAGCEVVAMVTPLPQHQTYAALRIATATRHRVPIITNSAIESIHGRGHVESVMLTNGQQIECDTVVFTGDWIPDNELARHGGVEIDPTYRGPIVDPAFRTSRAGVFAIGNAVHPADTADICALDGRRVARFVQQWLNGSNWPGSGVCITAASPISWVSPSVVHPGTGSTGGRLTLRVDSTTSARRITVSQGLTTLWQGRAHGRLIPNRTVSIPTTWIEQVQPIGDAIVVSATK